ncbi:hypothetical protein BH10BAC5_BH10BAC5_21620 [soil metagenome]
MKKILLILLLITAANIYSQDIIPADNLKMDSLFAANKGSVIVLNFWAYWCAPCKEEFPELVKLQNEYKDKGLKLLFYSLDTPEEIKTKTSAYLKDQKVDFVTYSNGFDKDEKLINYVDASWDGALPTTFIYNKNGKLVIKLTGKQKFKDFEKAIKDLL